MNGISITPPEPRSENLAVIVVDAACNVWLSSCSEAAANGSHDLFGANGTRLHPELEAVVSQLIADWLAGRASDSRVVALGAERRLRFSPLASSHGVQFALIVERHRAPDPLGRAVARFNFTRRQSQVLALVCEGASAGEIAARLSISEHTAHGYIKTLLVKTDSRNRAAMVARVLEWGHPGNSTAQRMGRGGREGEL